MDREASTSQQVQHIFFKFLHINLYTQKRVIFLTVREKQVEEKGFLAGGGTADYGWSESWGAFQITSSRLKCELLGSKEAKEANGEMHRT